jgi:hypothetical protein
MSSIEARLAQLQREQQAQRLAILLAECRSVLSDQDRLALAAGLAGCYLLMPPPGGPA